jgi:pimeloyl-ACP methyl ester carboxylesterase
MTTDGGLPFVDLGGTKLAYSDSGTGATLLYLSSCHWIADDTVFRDTLAQQARVIAPLYPGMGSAEDKNRLNSVDDLAFLLLDFIEKMGLSNVTVIGASFGGWVAAEMAVRRSSALSRLVLINPLGIKVSDRETRDITDFFGTPDDELRRRAFVDPAKAGPVLRELDDVNLRSRLQARETLTRYGWQPYMHHPRLRQRLGRINVPSLVLGADGDTMLSPGYARKYAELIPAARFDEIKSARHFAHIEKAEAVAHRVITFTAQK